MSPTNRRSFLRKLGLTVGIVTLNPGSASALVHYQKKSVHRIRIDEPPAPVDFRYSSGSWSAPICPPRDPLKSMVTEGGLYRRPGASGSPVPGTEGISFRLGGGGKAMAQRYDDPHVPVILWTLSSGTMSADVVCFSSVGDGGGRMDHLGITFAGKDEHQIPDIVISSPRPLEVRNEEDNDFTSGGICFVKDQASGRIFLAVDAPCSGERRGEEFVLRPLAEVSEPAAPARFLVTVPLGDQDEGDLSDTLRDRDRIRSATVALWKEIPSVVTPVKWDLWDRYEDFKNVSIRVIEQMKIPAETSGKRESEEDRRSGMNIPDQHFLSEAERYSGRDAEAHARLVDIWGLQNDAGMIVGAGGESDLKQTAAAIYSLCRNAELSGDWKYFNELFPDSFNAMMEFKAMRDKAWTEDTTNGKLGILPEGSPGPGWTGIYPEYTNTVWTLVALRNLLEVADRFFLPKKSEIREFYGQLRAAFIAAARNGTKTDEEGYSYLPMIHGARVAGPGGEIVRPQSCQDYLGDGLYPGGLFLKTDGIVASYLSVMDGIAVEDIPVETGPGPDGSYLPESAAGLAHVHLWKGDSDSARRAFVGFLNHASPLCTWENVQFLTEPETTLKERLERGRINLRAAADCVRYLRHMLVLEDDRVLRLLDGVTATDLADKKPMQVVGTPTRWGRVTLVHEPLDARAWKTRFRREPVNPDQAPPLDSIEMPRRLLPNFQFDTITGTTYLKNGPRVYIDGSAMEWECTWRDFHRY